MALPIAVIIPVKDGTAWIRRSVLSALAEPEVARVVVVDDGSRDESAAYARGCDDGSGRLVVTSLERNLGPSAARNVALSLCDEPLVAILDADDVIVPGRFGRLLARAGAEAWDFLADDLLLTPEEEVRDGVGAVTDEAARLMARGPQGVTVLTAEAFVRGNIPSPGEHRRELGFLKPLIRRDFLDAHGLRYREDLRLGEDYVLYVEALLAGARFLLTGPCGYLAVQRPASLSGQHATGEHRLMLAADDMLLGKAGHRAGVVAALRAHRLHVQHKADLRTFLDDARETGRLRALLGLLGRRRSILYIISEVVRARTGQVAPPPEAARGLTCLIWRPAEPDPLGAKS